MKLRAALLVVATVIVLVSGASPAPGQTVRQQDLLLRAARYVSDFMDRFSNVVSEEKYVQDAKSFPQQRKKGTPTLLTRGLLRHVELTSDFLLVRSPERNLFYTFRDVYMVNGEPVRDREDRLVKLFVSSATPPADQLEKIAFESARYTFGGDKRTINNPLLAVGFLQAIYQPRFRFSLKGPDPEAGADVLMIEFKEEKSPTLIRQIPDGDIFAKGRIWLKGATGMIVKTELTVIESDTIVTSFRYDDRFQIAVPYEMREDYWVDNDVVTGVATYDRFRQFTVKTEEQFQPPDTPSK